MAILQKIDSNVTGLRYAEETSIGVLAQEETAPTNTDWVPMEPNTYADFGGEITTIARNPINPSRQRKKGVTTDKDASGGINTDLTQANLQDLMQGFFFADLRRKGEEVPTQATATTDLFDVASTTDIRVNDLIWVTGFVNAANNGLHLVTAIVLDTTVEVLGSTLVTETPPAGANIVVVGHQFAAGDLDVTGTGDLSSYDTTTKDLTELGLVEGEWIYVGGDLAAEGFTNAENNGFKRIRSIATNAMTVDKSDSALVDESSTTETVRIWLGRVLRNELGTLITRRTYNLERTLGAPDDASPSNVQAEYLVGAVPNEFATTIATADKINADLSFVATDTQQILAADTLKSDDANATKLTLSEADAFNTSSDFKRIRLALVSDTDEAPTPLFAFVSELALTINNNNTPNKAVGVLGAFEVTSGTFQVSGSMTAYFSDIQATQSVQDNDDITLDFTIVKQNAGITFDLPLLSLGDGRPNVVQDEPITLPLSMDAATGAKIATTLDYTLHAQWYDYLPDAAGA